VAAARAEGSRRIEAIAHFILAETALNSRRYADALEVGGRALELARALGDSEVMALVLARTGMATAHEGRLDEAATRLREGLDHVQVLGFSETGAWCCEGLAFVAAQTGDASRAARLLGAAESLRRTGGGIVQPAEALAREKALALIEESLSDDDVGAALEAGRRLGLDEMIAEAQQVSAATS
jgi:hypothetical protein